MRRLINIFFVVAVALAAVSCFKDEVRGTVVRMAIYSQNVSGDALVKASDIESYAFAISKADDWEVPTWQDALDRRIVMKERPAESRTAPEYVGTFDAEAEYQVELDVRAEVVFMVVVDKLNRVYAYRKYETPINLPEVLTQLHLYAWRKSGNVNGWTMVNPFPDEPRESLIEEETTEEETTTVTE